MRTKDSEPLPLLLPGEVRIARWAMRRVELVQGNKRQLVSGAYVVLAALWGTIGSAILAVPVVIVVFTNAPHMNSVTSAIGLAFLGLAGFRLAQAVRHADE